MDEKERENYIRVWMLIQRHKDVLSSLLSVHLNNHNCTFQEFLRVRNHEIYHMYDNTTHCCQCPKEYLLPESSEITRLQYESVIDNSAGLTTHESDNAHKLCCRPIKSDLKPENIDIILVKVLLVHFCEDIFWRCALQTDSSTFGDFLNENKHKLYHLWRGSSVCCCCKPGYQIPIAETLIEEYQWNTLYSETGQQCMHLTGKERNYIAICEVVANTNLKPSHLETQLRNVLLTNCCSIRISIDNYETIVRDIFLNKHKLSDDEFQRYRSEIEECLKVIHGYLGKFQERPDDVLVAMSETELLPEVKGGCMIQIKELRDLLKPDKSKGVPSLHVGSVIGRISSKGFHTTPSLQVIDDKNTTETDICRMCKKEVMTHLCTDCRKSFCETCKKIHDSLFAPIVHTVSILNDNHVSRVKQTCIQHCKKYDMYCRTHNVPFCKDCSHKGCTIKPFFKCIMGIKESKRVKDISLKNEILFQGIDAAIREVQSEIESIPEKKENFVKEVDKSVDEFTKVLEKVKQSCLKDIDTSKNQIVTVLQVLQTCKADLVRCEKDLRSLKTGASELNMFLGLFPIEESLSAIQTKLLDKINEKKLSAIQPLWTVNNERIKQSFFNIGDTSIRMHPSVYKLLSSSDVVEIDEIRLEKKIDSCIVKKGLTRKVTIEGCAILPDHDVWFTDSQNKKVWIFKFPYKDRKEIKLSYTPFDIAPIYENQVAVSADSEKSIVLYNTDTHQQIDRFIFENAEGNFGGISVYNDELIIRLEDFGYYVISTKGKFLYKIPKIVSSVPYVAGAKGIFYYTQWNTGKVSCCDHSGRTNWEFDAKNVLDPPNGLCADENGNIFITGTFSNNVVLVASSGEEHREILSQKDLSVKEPRAIAYNSRTNRLLITNESGYFVVYAVKRGRRVTGEHDFLH